MYAIPYEYYEKYKIRRYGFHGTTHKYVSQQAAEMLGRPLEELRLVTCHLGNGSSICAINRGKSYRHLHGLHPAGRPADGHPGRQRGPRHHRVPDASTRTSPPLRSSTSSTRSPVCWASPAFPPTSATWTPPWTRATSAPALAKDMFNISVKKIIGSYIAEMGGVDAIIFTAGVGENDRSVRWDVCEHMEYLGVKIDPEKNKYRGKQMDISIDWARVRVLVIPTNEELMIAKDTERLVNEMK